VTVQTFGTGTLPDEKIETALDGLVDLRPAAIVAAFALRAQPDRHGGDFYRILASYGHRCRTDLEIPWEREDLVTALRRAAGRVK
jgi:S-adenosylmethionine synthetase